MNPKYPWLGKTIAEQKETLECGYHSEVEELREYISELNRMYYYWGDTPKEIELKILDARKKVVLWYKNQLELIIN